MKKKERREKEVLHKEKIDSLIAKIIYERLYDVPESFCRYISNKTFENIVTSYKLKDDFSKLESFVNTVYPTLKIRQSTLITICWILQTFDEGYTFKDIAYMFPQDEVAYMLKISGADGNTIYHIICNYAHHNIYIKKDLMEVYIKRTHGVFWKFKKSEFIFDHLINFFMNDSADKDIISSRKYIIPVIYEIFSRAKLRGSVYYNIKDVYKLTDNEVFIDINGLSLNDTDDYLDMYIANSCSHDIPIEFAHAMLHAENTTLIHNVINQPVLDHIKNLIYHSIYLNANNVNLIYWDIDKDTLLDDIAMSKVPVKSLYSVMDKFGIDTIKESTIRALINGGVHINELVPYMNNFLKYFDLIFSPQVFSKFIYKKNTTRIDKSDISYIMDLLSIDVDIDMTDGTSLPLLDYIIQTDALANVGLYIKPSVEVFIVSQYELFHKLSTDSKNKILSIKDERYMYIHCPNIMSESDYTRPISWFNDILEENPLALKYIPFHLVDKELLSKLLGKYGYIEPTSLHTYPINAKDVLDLIIQYNVGYGYIADLPTSLQIDAILKVLVDVEIVKS